MNEWFSVVRLGFPHVFLLSYHQEIEFLGYVLQFYVVATFCSFLVENVKVTIRAEIRSFLGSFCTIGFLATMKLCQV